ADQLYPCRIPGGGLVSLATLCGSSCRLLLETVRDISERHIRPVSPDLELAGVRRRLALVSLSKDVSSRCRVPFWRLASNGARCGLGRRRDLERVCRRQREFSLLHARQALVGEHRTSSRDGHVNR